MGNLEGKPTVDGQNERISTAEDFRAARRLNREAHRVTLPNGLTVLLARPEPTWFLSHGMFPATLAAKIASGGAIQSQADLAELADWLIPLLTEYSCSLR